MSADARGVEGGHAERGAHLAGEREMGRRGGAHAGDHVREAFVGIDVAADHVDEVEHAGGDQAACDLEPLLAPEPARHVLVHDHADADDVVAAHLRADLVQDLEAEAHAVLQRPAVVVGAPVGCRRPEGVQKMAVGFDLDAVQAALAATPGGGAVRAHDAADVVVLHRLGERAMGGLAHARGGEHRQPVGPVPVGAPAEMRDLAHHRGAVRVHGPRERLEIGDDALVEQMQVAERRRRVGGDHGRAADHGERDAALGLLLVVQAIAPPRAAILGVGRLVARAHDAVAQLQVLEPERLQQGLIARHPGGSARWFSRSAPRPARPRRDKRCPTGAALVNRGDRRALRLCARRVPMRLERWFRTDAAKS